MGLRGSETVEVVFGDCSSPGQDGWAKPREASRLHADAAGGASRSARWRGVAQGAYGISIPYDKVDQRHQFGQPIARFQAVEFMTRRTWPQDRGGTPPRLSAAAAAQIRAEYVKEAAMAKLSERVGNWVSDKAIQIHGPGLRRDIPVSECHRDVTLMEIGEGGAPASSSAW